MVEISTHLGPHRRLFMGPQFVFKTINPNASTTALNAGSSSVVSMETPLIDLSGDIELNSLDLTAKHYSASPIQFGHSPLGYTCTPTYIEVGPGSYQEDMPVFNIYTSANDNKQKFVERDDNLIESLADAMSELSNSGCGANQQQQQASKYGKSTAAIAINGANAYRRNMLSANVASLNMHSVKSNSIPTQGSYCLIANERLNTGNSTSSGSSGANALVDDESNSSSAFSSLNSHANVPSLENIQFQDEAPDSMLGWNVRKKY